MNCFICDASFQRFQDLFSHFRNLHGLASTGSEVRCTFDACPRVFFSFHKLKGHALLKHGVVHITELVECSQEIAVQPSSDRSDHNCMKSISLDCSKLFNVTNVNLQKSYMRFMTGLGSKPGISQKAIQNIAEELTSLINETKDFATNIVHILGLERHLFYDDITHEGFLQRGLQNAHRRLPASEKVYTWVRRKRARSPNAESTSNAVESLVADEAILAGCPRGLTTCTICSGESNVEKMKNLSTSEIEFCARSTFCYRQQWINGQNPTVTEILDKFPKFCTVPELIDLDFHLKYNDNVGDMMSSLVPDVVNPLLRYAVECGGAGIREVAAAASGKTTDWRVYSACKVIAMILKTSGKKRISGAEAFNRIITVVPSEKSLDEIDIQPYFRMMIHGRVGGDIITIKISSESSMLEGGSSVLEALDRLVKLFWMFNIQYTTGCENFLKFLHTAIYKLSEGSVPKSVNELLSVVNKYKCAS